MVDREAVQHQHGRIARSPTTSRFSATSGRTRPGSRAFRIMRLCTHRASGWWRRPSSPARSSSSRRSRSCSPWASPAAGGRRCGASRAAVGGAGRRHRHRRLRARHVVPGVGAAARHRHAAADLRPAVAAQGDPAIGGAEGAARRGGDLPGRAARRAAGGHGRAARPRLVRLHRGVQGRLPGGPRGRLHRHHVRPQRRLDRARRRRRGRRRGRRAGRRRRRAPAAQPGAREHHQDRRRPAALDLRHVLGGGGPRASSPPTASRWSGRAATWRCWPCWRAGACSPTCRSRCCAGRLAGAPPRRVPDALRARPSAASGGTSSSATSGASRRASWPCSRSARWRRRGPGRPSPRSSSASRSASPPWPSSASCCRPAALTARAADE